MSLEDIRRSVRDAFESDTLASQQLSGDWGELLLWENRIDELVEGQDPGMRMAVLGAFAHGYALTGQHDKAGHMHLRTAEVCEAVKHFSESVGEMVRAAQCFGRSEDKEMCIVWWESARDASAQHGLSLLECSICLELGKVLTSNARYDDAVEQHRRAQTVAQSVGENDVSHAQHPGRPVDSREDGVHLRLSSHRELVDALGNAQHFEEAEALFLGLHEGEGNAECMMWNSYLRGSLHASKGNFDQAAVAFQASMDVAEKHPALLQDPDAEALLRKVKGLVLNVGRASDAPPLSEIFMMMNQAAGVKDWPGVLRWESRLEDMLVQTTNVSHSRLFEMLGEANFNQGHMAKAAKLFERRALLLGKMKLFRDQATDMNRIGDCLSNLNNTDGATPWFQKARRLGAQHGFYSAECGACLGLGHVAMLKGQFNEAEELIRAAETALDFVEDEGERGMFEWTVNLDLAQALIETDRYEEAGPLIRRLRALADDAKFVETNAMVALRLAVRLQAKRGDLEQAAKEMQVLRPSTTPAQISEPCYLLSTSVPSPDP